MKLQERHTVLLSLPSRLVGTETEHGGPSYPFTDSALPAREDRPDLPRALTAPRAPRAHPAGLCGAAAQPRRLPRPPPGAEEGHTGRGLRADWATFAVGPGHGVQLPSGRLLVPAYTYRVDRRECFGKICRTSPHSFAFYSDDHGRTWRCGGLVPNLRSGECQLAAVDGGQAGSFLYCNARSPLGSRVQALSTDEGTSFLPAERVASLPETAWGCQGSIVGFPAPAPSRPRDDGWSVGPGSPLHTPRLGPGVHEPPEEAAGDPHGGQVPGGPCSHLQPQGDGPRQPGPRPGVSGDVGSWTLALPMPFAAPPQSPTWLLYSHPVGRRARLHMGIRLSQAPLDPRSWTEPWVIYEGPSGYSDLASVGPTPEGDLVFACLYESGARTSYDEISFCTFSLREVLENVPASPKLPSLGDKPRGWCWPS
ncbi:PREDICTED: sialidase-4 isoform X4 [Colobus angolensis palliatus]|uniref:sialidase-4 isoform X4 n=1 Tax=Colobus angolensis palliatus TaxID=336983 RepID=UPI0005F3FB24|nr:PREDICTED: sialidase-4 isoform X4 [Colobus angolensis palliatus]